MSGSNDREDIKRFLEEQFAAIEEGGEVTTIGMVHHAHTGPVELHSMAKGHGKWNNPEAMSFTFDMIATRHAKGVSSGGAQQYEIVVGRGGDRKQTSVLPFVRVGSANLTGPNGSVATEPPTQTGMNSQAMRLLEQFAQGSFLQNKDNVETLKFLLKELLLRLRELEENNRELWTSLKLVLMELQKQTHEQRLKEITAARMADFQKQIIKLAPSLLNMMAGREVFPLSTADTEFIEMVAAAATPSDIRMLQAAVMGKPGGEQIAVILADRFEQARKKTAEDEANEKRLMAGLGTKTYEEAERDAAGLAMRALKGQKLEELPEGIAARVAAAEEAEPAHKPAEAKTNGHVAEVVPPTANEGAEVLDAFLNRVGETGRAEILFGMIGETDPTLAKQMRAYHEKLKQKKT